MSKLNSKKYIDILSNPFIEHAQFRINQLDKIIKKNPKIMVTIAGDNGKHLLGKGLAKDQWITAYNCNYSEQIINKAREHFINKLQEMFEKLILDNLANTITFGMLPSANVGNMHYNVWGANSQNWIKSSKYPVLTGEGQARAMISVNGHNNPGVFGIITTPITGEPPHVVISTDQIKSLTTYNPSLSKAYYEKNYLKYKNKYLQLKNT